MPERTRRGATPPSSLAALSVLRSGGVGGLLRRRMVDVASLSAEQRAAVAALASSPPGAAGPDRFTFEVTITLADGTTRVVHVAEDAVPPALADILR